jgi:hypothetical protein
MDIFDKGWSSIIVNGSGWKCNYRSSHSELETYSMKVTGNDGGEWKHMAGDGVQSMVENRSAEYGRG